MYSKRCKNKFESEDGEEAMGLILPDEDMDGVDESSRALPIVPLLAVVNDAATRGRASASLGARPPMDAMAFPSGGVQSNQPSIQL